MSKGRWNLLLILLFAAAFLEACRSVSQNKSENPVAKKAEARASRAPPKLTAFVIHAEVPVYAKNDQKSQIVGVIPIGQKLKIAEESVREYDEVSQVWWLAVEAPVRNTQGGELVSVKGYIREQAYQDEPVVMVFRAVNAEDALEKAPFSLATSVTELFEKPDVKARVVKTLQVNEKVELMEVTEKKMETFGAYFLPGPDLPTEWLFVKTKDGRLGYGRGSEIATEIPKSLKNIVEQNFKVRRGWLLISGSSVQTYHGVENLLSQKANDNTDIVTRLDEKNGIVRIDGEILFQGSKYYLAADYAPGLALPHTRLFSSDALIPASKGVFHADFFELSKRHPHKLPQKHVADFNRIVGHNLNLQCSTVSALNLRRAGKKIRYYVLHPFQGPDSLQTERDIGPCDRLLTTPPILLEDSKSGLRLAGRALQSKATFVDLDQDGSPEIVSKYGENRSEYTMSIYRISDGATREIFKMNLFEVATNECPMPMLQGQFLKLDYPTLIGDSAPRPVKKFSELEEYCRESLTETARRLGIVIGKSGKFPIYLTIKKGKFVSIIPPKNLPADVPIRPYRMIKPAPAMPPAANSTK